MQRVREAERSGPDGFIPGAASAVAAGIFPHQRLYGEAFLAAAAAAAAVLEHGEKPDVDAMYRKVNYFGRSQIPSPSITLPESRPCAHQSCVNSRLELLGAAEVSCLLRCSR